MASRCRDCWIHLPWCAGAMGGLFISDLSGMFHALRRASIRDDRRTDDPLEYSDPPLISQTPP